MQKIQVQAEVEVKSLLAQLDTDELEGVVREAATLLTQRESRRFRFSTIPLNESHDAAYRNATF